MLFGETPSTGAPITFESHGSGGICFGRDGTLLVAIGDGAGFQFGADRGSAPSTYWSQALADGILRPAENVGSFRAQMVTSCSGKILRLDPVTGDGVPSNPFYDPAQPRAARSRVWALGLRNPFRMCVRPGTGAEDPSLGDPGTIYLGDVGWRDREELNVVRQAGQNFGWPLYEGIHPCAAFASLPTDNLDAPNPLGVGVGGGAWFRFQDLLQQATPAQNVFFPNPYDPSVGIAASTPTFVHTPPALEWHHDSLDARVPVFVNGTLAAPQVGTPDSGVSGVPFRGSCAVGGTWHSGLTFPAGFGPSYYMADLVEGWIKRFEFDANDVLLAVHDFAPAPGVVMLGELPDDHSLVYVGLQEQLRKLRYPDPASHTAFGLGCYDHSDSFYQYFADAGIAALRLTGHSLVLQPTATGYAASWGGGGFVAPVAPTVLPFTGDADVLYTASAAMPTPAGPVAEFRVHENGIVTLGAAPQTFPGTSSDQPTAAGFLHAAAAAFWSWHDYDVTEPGSGAITAEEQVVGSDVVLFLTWNGVENHAEPEVANPSTLQFQCNLTTGTVTIVWQSIDDDATSPDGSAHLVGWSPAGASPDGGSLDLAAALPIQTTPAMVALELAAAPVPVSTTTAGTTVSYTTSQMPEAAPGTGVYLGLLVLSFAASPGIDLGPAGAPGCQVYVAGLDIVFGMVAAAPTATVAFLVPPGLAPGIEFWAQSACLVVPFSLANGGNALGMTTSNGIHSRVGPF